MVAEGRKPPWGKEQETGKTEGQWQGSVALSDVRGFPGSGVRLHRHEGMRWEAVAGWCSEQQGCTLGFAASLSPPVGAPSPHGSSAGSTSLCRLLLS